MQRYIRWTMVILIALVAFGIAGTAQPPEIGYAFSYEGTAIINCERMIANDGPAYLDRDNTNNIEEHFVLVAWDGAGTIIFYQDSQANLGIRVNGIGEPVWTTPPAYNPITFQAISLAGNGLDEEIGFEAVGECEGLPYYGETGVEPSEKVRVPGCVTRVNIPETAVVGAFASTTAVYWKPGSLVNPEVEIEQGKTAWVLGMDANGQYYKILWSCQYLWVPVGTVGPNFDMVWKGTPLPTNVVE